MGLNDAQINILLELGHYIVLPVIYFGYKKIQKQIQESIDDRANKVALIRAAEVRQEVLIKLADMSIWQEKHDHSDEARFKDINKRLDHIIRARR